MLSLVTSVYEMFLFRKKRQLLYRIDPRIKLIHLVLVLTTIILATNTYSQILILAYLVSLTFIGADASRVWKSLRSMLKMLLLFYIVIYVVNAFPKLLDLGIAFQSFMAIFRFFMLIYCFSLFFTTTPLDDLAQALYKLKIPYHIAFTFTLSVRFIPTVAKDFITVYDAQRARGLELEKGSLLTRVRKFLALLIPVFVVSFLRVDRVAEALESRAFGVARRRTFLYELKIRPLDIAFLTLSSIPLLLIVYSQYYLIT